jgi:hypothetical protein
VTPAWSAAMRREKPGRMEHKSKEDEVELWSETMMKEGLLSVPRNTIYIFGIDLHRILFM